MPVRPPFHASARQVLWQYIFHSMQRRNMVDFTSDVNQVSPEVNLFTREEVVRHLFVKKIRYKVIFGKSVEIKRVIFGQSDKYYKLT